MRRCMLSFQKGASYKIHSHFILLEFFLHFFFQSRENSGVLKLILCLVEFSYCNTLNPDLQARYHLAVASNVH